MDENDIRNEFIFDSGYTARAVEPAKNYDVISFARAMNDDFGGRVKQLFDPEREAVEEALQTGQSVVKIIFYAYQM